MKLDECARPLKTSKHYAANVGKRATGITLIFQRVLLLL